MLKASFDNKNNYYYDNNVISIQKDSYGQGYGVPHQRDLQWCGEEVYPVAAYQVAKEVSIPTI